MKNIADNEDDVKTIIKERRSNNRIMRRRRRKRKKNKATPVIMRSMKERIPNILFTKFYKSLHITTMFDGLVITSKKTVCLC